jgi:hypothetical protein
MKSYLVFSALGSTGGPGNYGILSSDLKSLKEGGSTRLNDQKSGEG